MRIDSTSGLFRRPTSGLPVPSASAQGAQARPATDPTAAPEPVAVSRAARAYGVQSAQARTPAAPARLGAGPALTLDLSPEARAWLAQRGLSADGGAPAEAPAPRVEPDAIEADAPPAMRLPSWDADLHAEVPLPRSLAGARLNVAM